MDKSQYEPEQRFVIETFQKSFAPLKEQKIVLYGIGKNTEAILSGTNGFTFVGLMDQNTTGETIFGQKVMSNEEVIAQKPIVVIIARESVINIIFKRIQYLSTEYGIQIYNFQGKLLDQERLLYQNEALPYWNASEQELIEQINSHDIISFDIFDTLLMRKVLQPEDTFELVQKHLQAEGYDYPFASMRLQAEHALHNCPDLNEIYVNMQVLSGWDDSLIKRMKELEVEIDASLLMPRNQMCRIFHMAVSSGKKVYLLSDMYYPKEYLQGLLQQHGIVGYEDLLVSCDIKKQKNDGSLYQWFLSLVGPGTKLHVGDNRRVDVQKAIENGIDAYHVYSAYEMLMASAMQGVLSDVKNLRQRCILGMIIASIFNNPFVLYDSKGYWSVQSMEDVGYCFVAPLLTEYMKWFVGQVKKKEIQQVLFPSRDGYLMQKVYKEIADCNVESVYFRTSRRAASVAGIRDEADIWRIGQRKYHGTCEAYLKSRFGIEMKQDDTRKDMHMVNAEEECIRALLRDYKTAILQEANKERKQYLHYLDCKGILADKKQALFDFVAGGTVQYNLEQLLHKTMQGLYFATMNLPNNMYAEDTERIATAYGNIQSYGTQNYLGRYYLFLETVLIDDQGSLSHIDEEGQEIFEEESAKSNYREIEKLQSAVLHYVKDDRQYFSILDGEEPELAFVDRLYGMLFSKQCLVANHIKEVFQNDDAYDGIGSYRLWND